MSRRLSSLVALGAGAAILLTGCSGEDAGQAAPAPAPPAESGASSAAQPSSTSAEAGGDAVTWVNDFCGSMTGLKELQNIEKPTKSPDFQATKQGMVDMLTKFEGAMGTTLDKLKGLGPAPEPAGDQAKEAVVNVFSPARDQVLDAKSKIESATEQNQQPIIEAGTSLQGLGTAMQEMENPLKGIEASPELKAAGEKAQNCKALAG